MKVAKCSIHFNVHLTLLWLGCTYTSDCLGLTHLFTHQLIIFFWLFCDYSLKLCALRSIQFQTHKIKVALIFCSHDGNNEIWNCYWEKSHTLYLFESYMELYAVLWTKFFVYWVRRFLNSTRWSHLSNSKELCSSRI
jgi:hypothetical protein